MCHHPYFCSVINYIFYGSAMLTESTFCLAFPDLLHGNFLETK